MNENGDTFDTRAAAFEARRARGCCCFEHINHPDTARISFLATLRLECCVLFFVVVLFSPIYNEWFVTRRSWSSGPGVLIGTSVSAC